MLGAVCLPEVSPCAARGLILAVERNQFLGGVCVVVVDDLFPFPEDAYGVGTVNAARRDCWRTVIRHGRVATQS